MHQVIIDLEPGDIVTFNTRRMLHGRNAFWAKGPFARRHLRGVSRRPRHAQLGDMVAVLVHAVGRQTAKSCPPKE